MRHAAELIDALGGIDPRTQMCRCPACSDKKKPKLSVSDGYRGVVFHCKRGCSQKEVMEALKKQGLWYSAPSQRPHTITPIQNRPLIEDSKKLGELAVRRRKALYFWDRSQPIERTLAERYLREHRKIKRPLPRALRFLPRFSPTWPQPCLVAALLDDDECVNAVQLTFLDRDSAKKADLRVQRKTFGPMGRCAVRLDRAHKVLGLAEGVETALSASQLFEIPVWATLGAERLRNVAIPDHVRCLHIFADNGSTGRRCARESAQIYAERGFKVSISRPKAKGCNDFNDLIRSEISR